MDTGEKREVRMPCRNWSEHVSKIGLAAAVVLGLYLSSFYSYLLFHSLIEITTIAVAFALFILAWNTRTYMANGYLQMLGGGYAFIALIDLLHTLAYKGMGIFPGYGSNLATQLWIAARYLQAATLLVAPFFAVRRMNHRAMIGTYALVVSMLLAAICSGHFPACYVESQGLTSFKVGSEYAISAVLLVSLVVLFGKRRHFDGRVFGLVVASVGCTVLSELSFTAYVSVYGMANLVGHFFKLAAFYLIYRAVLVTGLKQPLDLVFRDLKLTDEELRKTHDTLAEKVRMRTTELRASEERYRSLIQKVQTAIVLHDGQGRILASNPLAQKLLGFSEGQLNGKPLDDPEWHFVREDGSAMPIREYPASRVLSARQPLRGYVAGIRRPDREDVAWMLVDAEPEYDGTGELSEIIVSFVEITERRRAETALRISEERHHKAQAMGHVGNWEYNLQTNQFWGSDEAKRIYGFKPEESLFTTEEVEACIPERTRVHQALIDLIEAGKPYHLEFEIHPRNAAGPRIIESVAELRRDEHGDPLKVVGVILDVTERKQTEQDLVLMRFALDSVHEAAYLTDENGRFKYVNDEACRSLGYTRGELLGMGVADIDPDFPAERWPSHWAEIKEKGSLTFEGRHKAKDGHFILVEIGANYFEYKGQAYNLAMVRDISERKRAADALQESEKRVRRKLDAVLSPEANIGALELSDIIDSEQIQRLMDEFYRLTHVGIGIIDLHGRVLVGTGWQDICTKFHRLNPKSCGLCIESDLELSRNVPPGTFKLYRCKNNMWDMATPIMLGGRQVGNIFLGQFLFDDETPDREAFRQQAQRYGFDMEEYLAALDRVPRWSRQIVNAAMSFYAAFAEMIGRLSYSNIKLASALEERRRAEESLDRLNRRLHAISNCNQILMRAVDEQTLLDDVCRIVCDAGYRLVWVGYAEPDDVKTLRPVAWAEPDGGSTAPAKLTWEEHPDPESPAGQAIRSGEVVCVPNLTATPQMTPWQEEALRHGYRSGIALPLKDETAQTFGVLKIYSSEPNAFTPDEIRLLEELAGDLAFGVTTLRSRDKRKRTEQSLAAGEAKMSSILDNIGIGVSLISPQMEILELNRRMREWFPAVDPGQHPICYRALNDPPRETLCNYCPTCKTLRDGLVHEATTQTPQAGGVRNYRIVSSPILDTEGKVTAAIEMVEDITEKLSMESQFRQAQKMESIGRLAGGVAHDFNNMLGVIGGYAELALEKADPAQPLFADLQEIRKAAARSADLTRQLLAFARKQTVAPKVLDLNESVSGMLNILRRLIGENIALTWRPEAGTCPVMMDPSQIDQILANLCVNARDAIAGVGKIAIATQSATLDEGFCANRPGFSPGHYVLLTVADSGCGMDSETLGKMFEPFFTTKGLGKGTGLGLATVYGIVKQNNGSIDVISQPGRGTTFKIYLPWFSASNSQTGKTSPANPAAQGHETILLVEDERASLELVRQILEKLGYRVHPAATPGEAIRVAAEYAAEIQLLITDVVMPEMTGRDLAKRIGVLNPAIRHLYMSGYTSDVIARQGVLDAGIHYIQKPFSMPDLAAKVREALG